MHPLCVVIFMVVFIVAYLISKCSKWWNKKTEYDEYGLEEITLGEFFANRSKYGLEDTPNESMSGSKFNWNLNYDMVRGGKKRLQAVSRAKANTKYKRKQCRYFTISSLIIDSPPLKKLSNYRICRITMYLKNFNRFQNPVLC